MSVHITSKIWKLEGMDPHTKLVLLKFGDHANDDGVCWPSIKRVVKETGVKRATVFKKLKELELMGVIARTPRPNETTVFLINPDKWKGGSTTETGPPGGPGGSTESAKVGPPGGPKPSRIRTINETPRCEVVHEEDLFSMFDSPSAPKKDNPAETLYAAYPRKEGKPAAIRAINAALKRCKLSFPDLLKSVEFFARTVKAAATETKFIPHPATWFNQDRWNDNTPPKQDDPGSKW